MWQCPKCKRAFRAENQHHFCGKVETVDQYISEQADEVQLILQKIRETIRTAAPDAVEKISWQMPTFWLGENLIHFAAAKKHIGIYPGGEVTAVFADKLTDYKTAKGTIQLPLDKPVDYKLIEDITRYRVSTATKEKSRSFDKNMLAYCGLYCEQCSFKLAHDENNVKHLERIPYTVKLRDLAEYDCGGCKSGHCICGVCKIKPCASGRNIDHCSDCIEFPCGYIKTFENDGIPHHKSAVENFRMIRQYGIRHWFDYVAPLLKCKQCGERQSWYYFCSKHEKG